MRAYILILAVFLGLVIFFFFAQRDAPESSSAEDAAEKIEEYASNESAENSRNNSAQSSGFVWNFDFDSKEWQASSDPPSCPEPLAIDSPVNVSLASGILYPGQYRGSDYKPHGGFRFDNRAANDIEVRAVIDGYLLKGSKYMESGEVQYLLFYGNDCGQMVMHDHFLVLSEKLAKAFENFSEQIEGDSRTTQFPQKIFVQKGEVLAAEIGYSKGRNIFVDFGMYDLRKTNEVSRNLSWAASHQDEKEYGFHAFCWFDNLKEPERSIVKSLPAGGHEGKTSDYCS